MASRPEANGRSVQVGLSFSRLALLGPGGLLHAAVTKTVSIGRRLGEGLADDSDAPDVLLFDPQDYPGKARSMITTALPSAGTGRGAAAVAAAAAVGCCWVLPCPSAAARLLLPSFYCPVLHVLRGFITTKSDLKRFFAAPMPPIQTCRRRQRARHM
jgi:hypothetical protein